jgi:hypothetical protein
MPQGARLHNLAKKRIEININPTLANTKLNIQYKTWDLLRLSFFR